MKRPSDQAKLLLFALLRSTATALATTGDKSASAVPKLLLPNIQLRLATRTDVSSLHRCNLACLPENYNADFYLSHLQQWPGLALVAEHVQNGSETTTTSTRHNNNNHFRDNSSGSQNHYQPHHFHHHQQPQAAMFAAFPRTGGNERKAPEPKIVAYVLGKVDQRPRYDYTLPEDEQLGIETLGHVTSLAVLHEYRRQGLAQALMQQLHFHLEHYQAPPTEFSEGHKVAVTGCGLHVRKSNAAACRLYENDGYEIQNVIPNYYQDGEDAYFMKKRLSSAAGRQDTTSLLHRYSGRQCWNQGGPAPHLRLPRRHEYPPAVDHGDSSTEDSNDEASSSSSTTSSPGLLTGTM